MAFPSTINYVFYTISIWFCRSSYYNETVLANDPFLHLSSWAAVITRSGHIPTTTGGLRSMKAAVLEICAAPRNPSHIRPFTHKKSARLVVYYVAGSQQEALQLLAFDEIFRNLDQKQTAFVRSQKYVD